MALARLRLLTSALLLNDTSNDTVFKALLIAASKAVEKYCRRTLESASYTDQYYSGDDAIGGWPYRNSELWLDEWPVTALTTVKIWDGTDSYDTETSSYYELVNSRHIRYPAPGQEGNASYGRWPRGKDNIKISYTAGYTTTNWDSATYDTTQLGTVPQDLEMAVAMLAAYHWRKRGAAGIKSESMGPRAITYADVMADGGITIPPEIASMLAPWLRVDI